MDNDDAIYEYESVALIPIPDGLSPELHAEFVVFRECLIELEKEWEMSQDNKNEIQKAAHEQLNDLECQNQTNHEISFEDCILVSERQYEKAVERIKNEYEEARKALFENLIRELQHLYKCITGRLKDLMGKDYQSYIERKKMEFPEFISDMQMKTRYQPAEEIKIKFTSMDAAKELQKIDSMYKDYLSLAKIVCEMDAYGKLKIYGKDGNSDDSSNHHDDISNQHDETESSDP